MANVWVSGSVAYDTIFNYGDSFSTHFLADQLDNINASFYVPSMHKAFGGCAGNICYSAAKLGLSPALVASVGESDFHLYDAHLQALNVDLTHLHRVGNAYTAQAQVLQDKDGSQITMFHPGAMEQSGDIRLTDASGIELMLIGPDSLDGILQHVKDCVALGVPILLDPGQSTPNISGEQMKELIGQATWLVVNDYEFELIQKNTSLSLDEIRAQLDALIITQGDKGAIIYTKDAEFTISVISVDVVDVVGAGDAYRAGLIYGILNQLDWQTTGQIAGLCAAYKVEVAGCQSYNYTRAEFETRYERAFGQKITLV